MTKNLDKIGCFVQELKIDQLILTLSSTEARHMSDEKTKDAEEAAERETITVAERQSGKSGTPDAKPTITIAERGKADDEADDE